MKAAAHGDLDLWVEEALMMAQSLSDIGDLCQLIAAALGFTHFLFGVVHVADWKGLLTNFPSTWSTSFSKEYDDFLNPILKRAMRSSVPFFWNENPETAESQHLMQPGFLAHRLSHGVVAGAPYGDGSARGILSLAANQSLDVSGASSVRAMTSLVLSMLLERVGQIAKPESPPRPLPLLSARERECLLMSANGMVTRVIAKHLSISQSTVTFHINHCIEKLGVHSRSAAIAQALVRGEITAAEISAGAGRVF